LRSVAKSVPRHHDICRSSLEYCALRAVGVDVSWRDLDLKTL
jgi:hypothetical protein